MKSERKVLDARIFGHLCPCSMYNLRDHSASVCDNVDCNPSAIFDSKR